MDTLFFVLSKIGQFCIEPLNWVVVFVLLSLLFLGLRKPLLCKRFLILALTDLVLVGWLPTSEVFLRALEDKIPRVNLAQVPEGSIGGIVILGGAIDGGEIIADRGEISIGSAAERITKAFELIHKYPNLPLIYSGNSGSLSPKGIPEADAFRRLLAEQGFSDKSVHFENRSRNTYENAIFIRRKKCRRVFKALAINYLCKPYAPLAKDLSEAGCGGDFCPSGLSDGQFFALGFI